MDVKGIFPGGDDELVTDAGGTESKDKAAGGDDDFPAGDTDPGPKFPTPKGGTEGKDKAIGGNDDFVEEGGDIAAI